MMSLSECLTVRGSCKHQVWPHVCIASQARLTEIAAQNAEEFLSTNRVMSSSAVSNSNTAHDTKGSTLNSGLAPDGGLVVFRTALMHLARITRILSMEQV